MHMRFISWCLAFMCCLSTLVDAGCMRPPQGPTGPTGPTGDIGPTGGSSGSFSSYGFGVTATNPLVLPPESEINQIPFVDGFTSPDIDIDKGVFVVQDTGTYLIGWSARLVLTQSTGFGPPVTLNFYLFQDDFSNHIPPDPQGAVFVSEAANQEVNVQAIATLPAGAKVGLAVDYDNANPNKDLLVNDFVIYIIRIQ